MHLGRTWLRDTFLLTLLLRSAAGNQSDPCAKALLLVAHRDDETFFAGEALLGRKASLPWDCRRAWWHVVVVAGADNPATRQELHAVLNIARSHTLAAIIVEEVWDYDDCNMAYCARFVGGSLPIEQRLKDLLTSGNWDYVVTHNEHGEYHHWQHVGLHMAVRDALQTMPNPPQMLVFNPIPELNVSVSPGKARMLEAYMKAIPTPARRMTVQGLGRYTEHLVPVEAFIRPKPLGVAFAHNMLSIDLPFMYSWVMMPGGKHPKFSSQECLELVKVLFDLTWFNSCGRRHTPQYPEVCRELKKEKDEISPRLATLFGDFEDMVHLDEARGVSEPTPGSPTLRCSRMQRIGSFGEVVGWEISAEVQQPCYFALMVLRRITVGWKKGYKGRTYKILRTTTPKLLTTVRKEVHWPEVDPLRVQPDDVVGWQLFLRAGDDLNLYPAMPEDMADEFCIGGRGCDEAGLCTFDIKPPEELMPDARVQKVSVRVAPRRWQRPSEASPFFEVMPALNISEYVDADTTYEELMTIRQKLDHSDLGIFEDKIRLRTELLPAAGVLATPSIHLSNTDFDIAHLIEGRHSYVVKPSHMSESQNVFVMHNGINLLRQAWGWPGQSPIEEIQAAVYEFSQQKALDWECKALVATKPGVIVEELVLAEVDGGRFTVDEFKFYTVFGQVAFGEEIFSSAGTVMEIDRDGRILTNKMECPPFCVRSCYTRMVEIAEKVATYARADFLRVDVLVEGNCDGLYVSEVELFPASDFSPFLKAAVAARWRQGYAV
ncbi:unnamed protein product [Symbiodinium natans]|uniref:ATP-grasp domain-containing protein n=1 Tax=Symbiodinium natans TaxID=878477 RepID=A0A812GA21_9DINO|nr:unnamed protein product [Symbiodinium natans]